MVAASRQNLPQTEVLNNFYHVALTNADREILLSLNFNKRSRINRNGLCLAFVFIYKDNSSSRSRESVQSRLIKRLNTITEILFRGCNDQGRSIIHCDRDNRPCNREALRPDLYKNDQGLPHDAYHLVCPSFKSPMG